MKLRYLLSVASLFPTSQVAAQADSPYARFGYEGTILRTPQERQQRMMLLVPNTDTCSAITQVGFDPANQRYYLFGKGNQVLRTATLSGTDVTRFLSVDPLTKSYPHLTPYQFASNTPIMAIDLDGLEAVVVTVQSMRANVWPTLKRTEWYELEGKPLEASFAKAAKYNIATNNPGAYQSIADRHNFYSWASTITSKRNVMWFNAASDVTGATMVGAADVPNLAFMNSQEEDFMRGANRFLLGQNISNFGPYILNESSPVTWHGTSFGNLKGAALDNQMVVIEQTELQGFLDGYKANYIRENGKNAWTDLSQGINTLFASKASESWHFFLKWATPESNQYAQDKFKKQYGDNTQFDFMNIEHRIFQGQKMAEYYHNNSDEK